MNAKNRLIEKLLKVAKKHKILTYPVLALVALISIFSYFFDWSTGAGKRVVAVVMVMVMLVSQSYFLTSSATEIVDTEKTVKTQMELQGNDTEEQNQDNDSLIDNSEASEQDRTEDASTQLEEITTEATSEQNASTEENMQQVASTEGVSGDDVSTSEENEPEVSGSANSMEAISNKAPEVDLDEDTVTVETIIPQSGSGMSAGPTTTATKNGDDTYQIKDEDKNKLIDTLNSTSGYTQNGYYQLEGLYLEATYNTKVTDYQHLKLGSNGKITLYAKYQLAYFKVVINPQGGTYKVSGDNVVKESGDHTYKVPVIEGTTKATLNITELSKEGYESIGASNNAGQPIGKLSDDKKSITVDLSGGYEWTIVLQWEGESYTALYARSDTNEESGLYIQNLKFDDKSLEVWANPETVNVDNKPGYKFHHWEIGSFSGEQFMPEEGMKKEARDALYQSWKTSKSGGGQIVITPAYQYMGIDGGDADITYQYKKAETTPRIVKGYYTGTEETGDFEYQIAEDSKEKVQTLKEQYGICVEATDNGISVKTEAEGPKKTTISDGSQTVHYTITDGNAKDTESEKTKTFTITIKVEQRVVHLISNDIFVKTYDGTRTCTIDKPLLTDVDGITVTCTKAEYDKADAGERTIELSEPIMKFTPSMESEKDNYILDTIAGKCIVAGRIEKRIVFVKTSALLDSNSVREYVRAGEKDNPQLLVEEDKDKYKGENCGFINGDEVKLQDAILFTVPERDDYSMLEDGVSKKTYTIDVSEPEDSNYQYVLDRNDMGKFDVILEEPELGETYWIDGNLTADGWYGASSDRILRPKSGGGYDRICTSDGEEGEQIVLTEENTKDGTITFQLKDSRTGAFTSWKTIEVKVDTTAPEYIGYTLEEGGTNVPGSGLYFPSEGGDITFGNYYNHTIKFTIRYRDVRSNPKTLYYTLTGSLGSNKEMTALFGEADENGYATASFEIMAGAEDKIGTILFAADDKAGNRESFSHTMERHGTEWAVEQTVPTVSPLTVKAGEITVSNNADRYYADCTAYVTADDVTAGIYGITWYVNDEEIFERVSPSSQKVKNYTFTLPINEASFETEDSAKGQYEVSAVVWDNAKNHSEKTNTVKFMVDDVPPVLVVTHDYDVYTQKAKVTFYTYDELSGVGHIDVYDANGNQCTYVVEKTEKNEDGYMVSYCYFETTAKGDYKIVIEDKAGNLTSENIKLDKVSDEIPDCPTVTVTPEINDKGWITAEEADVRIGNVTETKYDKMPVVTYYERWKEDGEQPLDSSSIKTGIEYQDLLLEEGKWNLKVWSESLTGKQCDEADSHLYTLNVDGTAPQITYQVQKDAGSSLLVNFTISDSVSGVDKDSIRVMHGADAVLLSLEASEDGLSYSGSFTVTEVGNYTIQASDVAGNKAGEEIFSPMSMKVNPVRNITETTATVGARIFRGTFAIKSASITYRKLEETEFSTVDAVSVVDEETGNVTISAVLDNLSAGTEYAYKINAVSDGDEVLEYIGYFCTLATDEKGIRITGTARYADNREGTITVGLIRGYSWIRSTEVDTSENTAFTFDNVQDGSYNLVATDGVYSRTVRVVIVDGNIVYPESDIIDLVLSGISTSVEVENEETPDVSAEFSDMDATLSNADNLLIEAGGNVEYKLTAKLVQITSVDEAALAAMYTAAGNKIVGAFLDLSLYKIVTDENGDVSRTRVSKLGAGASVSVTIPLGDLAEKPGLTVVRIHQDGDTYTGKQLADMDNNPSTYTVTTTQFSTYAVLYDKPEEDVPDTEDKDTTETSGTGSSHRGETVVNRDNQQSVNKGAKAVEIAAKTKTAKATTTSSSVGSLRSSSTAKTGDEAPVAAVGVIFIMTMGGLVILRRKTR